MEKLLEEKIRDRKLNPAPAASVAHISFFSNKSI